MLSKKVLIISLLVFATLLFISIGLVWKWLSTPAVVSIAAANVSNTNQISNVNAKPVSEQKGLKDAKLQSQSDKLLPLFNNMPSVPVFTIDEPILKTGSETQKGVGYTVCLTGDKPIIYLKKEFLNKSNQKQLVNILKHELVHAWFCWQGVQVGHDERFRKKFKEVGGIGN
jgi:hypothetical protein